jgi:hypothetical protein
VLQSRCNEFFHPKGKLNKIHSNAPDFGTLTKAKEKFLEQDKQGLDSSKPVQ